MQTLTISSAHPFGTAAQPVGCGPHHIGRDRCEHLTRHDCIDGRVADGVRGAAATRHHAHDGVNGQGVDLPAPPPPDGTQEVAVDRRVERFLRGALPNDRPPNPLQQNGVRILQARSSRSTDKAPRQPSPSSEGRGDGVVIAEARVVGKLRPVERQQGQWEWTAK